MSSERLQHNMTMHAQHVQVPSEVGRVTQRRVHSIILEIANIQAKQGLL